MPPRSRPFAVRSSLVSGLAAAALVFSAGGAAADCSGDKPCITKLEPVPARGGSIARFTLRVHWSSACKYDKFHLRLNRSEYSPKEFGRNRGQLCNRRSETVLLTSAHTGARISASIQGCETVIIGKDSCTPFSPTVTTTLISPQHAAGCRNYASRAVGAVKLARETYKCDPKVISGPRWSSNFEEHRNWCETVEPKTANFEDRERNRIMHECRIQAGKPQGTSALTVTPAPRGDFFTLTGSGYAPNARVIIRVSGPAGRAQAITSNFANAQGRFTAKLTGIQVCNKAGTIIFTAEDQDKPASPPVQSTCKP